MTNSAAVEVPWVDGDLVDISGRAVVESWPVRLVGLPGECEIRWLRDGTVEWVFTDAKAAKFAIDAALDGKITVVTTRIAPDGGQNEHGAD